MSNSASILGFLSVKRVKDTEAAASAARANAVRTTWGSRHWSRTRRSIYVQLRTFEPNFSSFPRRGLGRSGFIPILASPTRVAS